MTNRPILTATLLGASLVAAVGLSIQRVDAVQLRRPSRPGTPAPKPAPPKNDTPTNPPPAEEQPNGGGVAPRGPRVRGPLLPGRGNPNPPAPGGGGGGGGGGNAGAPTIVSITRDRASFPSGGGQVKLTVVVRANNGSNLKVGAFSKMRKTGALATPSVDLSLLKAGTTATFQGNVGLPVNTGVRAATVDVFVKAESSGGSRTASTTVTLQGGNPNSPPPPPNF